MVAPLSASIPPHCRVYTRRRRRGAKLQNGLANDQFSHQRHPLGRAARPSPVRHRVLPHRRARGGVVAGRSGRRTLPVEGPQQRSDRPGPRRQHRALPYAEACLAKYGSLDAWRTAAAARMASLGLNTVGAWSDAAVAAAGTTLAITRSSTLARSSPSALPARLSRGATPSPMPSIPVSRCLRASAPPSCAGLSATTRRWLAGSCRQ